MRKTLIAAAFVLLAAAPGAQAFPKLDCKNPISSVDMDNCAGIDFKAADGKLNAVYKTLMSRYGAPNQTLLKAAQRDWLKFRDSECTYETNLTVGGTINSMMFTMCRTAKTKLRTTELNAQLHCEEGDMSCNPPDK